MLPFKIPILPKILLPRARWLEQQQTSILSAALIITVANAVSSLAGLIRERILINYFFGTPVSEQAYEAFKIAFQIPDSMFQLIVLGALSASFIPIFTNLKKSSKDEAFAMTNVVMSVLFSIFLIISIIVFVFAEPITTLRTGTGFTDYQIEVTTNLTRIMLIAQIIFMISNIFSGILQSFQKFIMPALAPIFYNVGIVLGTVLFYDDFGIYAAGFGVVLGALLHMIIQAPLVFKLGFTWDFSFNTSVKGVKELFRMAPPRLLTYGITEIQNNALGFFTTSLAPLSFTVMRLGQQLMAIPIRLFGVSIGQASLPFLSAESKEHDTKEFVALLVRSLNQIQFLALPASILLLILRVAIVRLTFGDQNVSWETTLSTGRVVGVIAVSIAAQALVQLLIRSFHALKDTKTPLYVTLLLAAIFLIGNTTVVFFTDWGVVGLAAVTSATAFIELFAFLWLLNKKLKGTLLTNELIIPQLKMYAAGFLMAVFLYLPFRIFDELVFDTSRTIELIALTITTGTIGLLAYVYFAALLNIEQLRILEQLASSIGNWRKSLSKTTELVSETSTEEKSV